MIKIEVIYALPENQDIFVIESKKSINVKEAIRLTNLSNRYPIFKNIENFKVGVYGNLVNWNFKLKDKDRLEIYRNLVIDPKQARILRAQKKRKEQGIKLFGA